MASPGECLKGLWFITIILIFSITSLPPKPAAVQGLVARSSSAASDEIVKQRMLALGSRPPQCENKCLSCRPCKAKLVIIISPHHDHEHDLILDNKKNEKKMSTSTVKEASVFDHSYKDAADESYYLVTWKCTCENKFYPP